MITPPLTDPLLSSVNSPADSQDQRLLHRWRAAESSARHGAVMQVAPHSKQSRRRRGVLGACENFSESV